MTQNIQIKKLNIQDYFTNGLGVMNADALSFIVQDPKIEMLIKRTERLRAALLLLDSSLVQAAPSLQEVADNLLFELLAFAVSQGQGSAVKFKLNILKAINTLDSLFIKGFVSEANTSLLKGALLALLKSFTQHEDEITNSQLQLLADDLLPNFTIKTRAYKGHIKDTNDIKDKQKYSHKGHIKDSADLINTQAPKVESQKTEKSDMSEMVSKIHKQRNLEQNALLQSRRMQIIELLNAEPNLTVSEITEKLGNKWSQKTIQRELLSMLKDGTVTKKGEKRWTRYSINYQ